MIKVSKIFKHNICSDESSCTAVLQEIRSNPKRKGVQDKPRES